jgi:hypothetical protein
MNLEFIEINGLKVAEVGSAGVAINTTQDALDLIADAGYQGASHIILHENNLGPGFFDLKTGMAGEILQKFTNYRMGLVIIGDFDKFESESLRAFITECNRGRQIAFVPDKNAALAKITG